MNETTKAGSERRLALTVDTRVRKFFISIWFLSVVVIGLFGALAILIALSAPTLPDAVGRWFFVAIGGTAFLLVSASLGLSVYATTHIHRVAGAAHQICERLRAMSEEGLQASKQDPLVRLRPSDYLHDVADEVNHLASRLCQTKN